MTAIKIKVIDEDKKPDDTQLENDKKQEVKKSKKISKKKSITAKTSSPSAKSSKKTSPKAVKKKNSPIKTSAKAKTEQKKAVIDNIKEKIEDADKILNTEKQEPKQDKNKDLEIGLTQEEEQEPGKKTEEQQAGSKQAVSADTDAKPKTSKNEKNAAMDSKTLEEKFSRGGAVADLIKREGENAKRDKEIKYEKDPKKPVKRLIQSEILKEQGSEESEEEIVTEFSHHKRSIKLYKRIAYSFVALVIIMVGVISYYSLVTLSIVLIPNQERKSNNIIFDIYNEDGEADNNASIKGLVKEIQVSTENSFEASGSEVIGKEAVGTVTIYNNYTQNQPLVATTRLLSPDSKLFRTEETVNVPAGGSVEVRIYADEPSPEMAIGPTEFTIPGLWAGLQDKIYAESKEDITYRQKVKKYIVDNDFDNAKKELRQKLLNNAKQDIEKQYDEYGEVIYKIDENSIVADFDAESKDVANEFNGKMTADVVIVAFSKEKAAELAKAKFASALSEKMEVLSFDENSIIYTLNSFDVENGKATVNATFEGKVTLKENSDVIEIDKILGLKKDQLQVYLENLDGLAGFEVNFKPSFIPDFMKNVPKLEDKIDITIKK